MSKHSKTFAFVSGVVVGVVGGFLAIIGWGCAGFRYPDVIIKNPSTAEQPWMNEQIRATQ